jgi:hypothetical protein
VGAGFNTSVVDFGFGAFAMPEEVARRPTTARSKAKKIETDPERIAEQLATALREAGYECVIALPKSS